MWTDPQKLADRASTKAAITGQTHAVVSWQGGYRVVKLTPNLRKQSICLIVQPGQTVHFTPYYPARKP
jgi:hypothetical protein